MRLPDRGTAVADAGNHRIVFFDASGAVSGTQGGEGEGPGEYTVPSLLAPWVGDSLAVWDRRTRQLSILSASGEYVRSLGLQTTDDAPDASVLGVYADGSLLATGFVAVPRGEVPDGRLRYSAPLYHFSRDGEPVADLGLVPGTETYYRAMDGGFSAWEALFARPSGRVTAGDRLVLGIGERYALRFLTPGGEPLLVLRRVDEPTGITPEMRDAPERTVLEAMSPGAVELAREVYAEMPIPDVEQKRADRGPVPSTASR